MADFVDVSHDSGGGMFVFGSATEHMALLGQVPFVVIDLETTGLVQSDGRITEIAIVRVENGRTVDEWATLIDPECDPGPTYIHGISADMLLGAPTFRDVVGEILARLDGAVVVAHNAAFDGAILRAELDRLCINVMPRPALCTLQLSGAVLDAPNLRLATCCKTCGIAVPDAHTALGDARATAALFTQLSRISSPPQFLTSSAPVARAHRGARPSPRIRVGELHGGEDGWMRSLLTKLPLAMTDDDNPGAHAYLDALGDALADGTVTADEIRDLADLACRSGMGASTVAALNRRFLDGLRDAALADDILTPNERQRLNQAAAELDEPEYFADLTTTPDDHPSRGSHEALPRVWCSPTIPVHARHRLARAGYVEVSNITRNLTGAVVSSIDLHSPRVERARDLGVRVIDLADLEELLGAGANAAAQPVDLSPPQAPAGWYPDPTTSAYYRYWNGSKWTSRVSPGDGTVIQSAVP